MGVVLAMPQDGGGQGEVSRSRGAGRGGAWPPDDGGEELGRAAAAADRVTPRRGGRLRVARATQVQAVPREARHLEVVAPDERAPVRRWSTVSDAGMATAEYAIATLAAVGFAGLLVVILKSDAVRGLLMGIVRRALTL